MALISLSFLLGLLLQRFGSCLYRPEVIQEIQIVPAPSDLTPILFVLSTNWLVAAPLVLAFLAGAYCLLPAPSAAADGPQLIKIKYIH